MKLDLIIYAAIAVVVLLAAARFAMRHFFPPDT
jgi:preprotein translocase subunit Sec61beta